MKNDKQAIRYIGFECRSGGERCLTFSVDEAGVDRLLIAFEIAGMFFAERRILIQEAAGICYSKLKDLLGRELHASARFVLTDDDISQYKQIPHPARHRSAKLHEAN